MRTLTNEEPMLGCADWIVVEGDTNLYLDFEEDYQLYDPDNFNGTLTVIAKWGTEDVTSRVNQYDFEWSRYTEDAEHHQRVASDAIWDAAHAYGEWQTNRKQLVLQQSDLSAELEFPTLVRFRCDVTLRDGNDEVLMNDYVQLEYNS